MAQFGFYFNQSACVGCRACQVACCDRNNLVAGESVRTVTSYESGKYPEATIFHNAAACNHCANPACVAVCPTGATVKDPVDGTVYRVAEQCIGCGACANACPYHHPFIAKDKAISMRCDGCKSFRDQGLNPVCVDACVMRALECGDIEALKAAHPEAVADMAILPSSADTNPSCIITMHVGAADSNPRAILL